MNEFDLAEQHLQAGRYKKAEALFLELRERLPTWPRAHIGYARSLAGKDQSSLQLEAWRQAVKKFPKSEAALAGLVNCLGKAGPQALPELLRLRNEGVALDEVEKSLGNIALVQERFQDAVAHFYRALSIAGNRPWVRLKLVETLVKLQRHEESVTECMAALQDEPLAKLPPYAQVITSALACSRTREAGELLQAFLDRAPDALLNVTPVLRSFNRAGERDAALAAIESWFETRPEDADAGRLYVRVLKQAGFERKAAETALRLRDQHPEHEDLRLEAARLLTTILDWQQAYEAWGQVRAHQPLMPEAIARTAQTLLRAGEAGRSVAEIAAVLQQYPSERDACLGGLLYARRMRRWNSVMLLNAKLLESEANPLEQASLLLEQAEVRYRLGQSVGDLGAVRKHIGKSKPGSRLRYRFDDLTSKLAIADQQQVNGATVLPEPVDVVYTWVDGKDPVWLKKFQHHSGIDLWDHSDDSQNWRRYEHFEEIYFSLQTLDRYFPQARNIFIVTDNQTFDLSPLPESVRRKTKFVFHTEIIPADEVALPTFVSDVIEAFLDRIPGLSETFLYFNDDVFLGRPLLPEDLFDDKGRPIATVVKHEWPTDREAWKRQCDSVDSDSHVARIPVTLECFERRMGSVPGYTDNHQFRVRTRTQYRRTMEIFGADLKASLFHSRIREKGSLRTCMLLDWIADHENTHTLRLDDRTVRTGWLGMQEFDWEHVALLLEFRPKSFCLNVTPERRDRYEYLATNFLSCEHKGVDLRTMPRDPFYQACLDISQASAPIQTATVTPHPDKQLIPG